MAANLFSQQLTLLLDRLGMSRYRLARLSGLSISYVGLLASGARSPSDAALRKLVPVLQVPFAELKAWVEAGRLGEEGLAGLRAHLDGPVTDTLLPALTRYAAAPADEAPLLEALRSAVGAVGLALWRPRGETLQIVAQAGLPSEYVAIANLRFKEQGLTPGPLFPAIGAYLTAKPVTVPGLLESPDHPLHFYAKTLGFDTLLVLPLVHGGRPVGTLAAYMPAVPRMSVPASRPWLELAAAVFGLAASGPSPD